MTVGLRTPLALLLLAFIVRAALFAIFPDPAYNDSYYYVDVARSIAAGQGLSVDFVWIFAEVGNHLPDPAVLPVASNAHWLPLASFLQAPFITVLGPTALASALPGMLFGSFAAPLTWLMARDLGSRPLVAAAAGVLVAVPGTATVFMAQPETYPLSMVLVPLTLWAAARGLRGDGRAFVLAGFGAGLMALARNDGILLAAALGLVWVLDRWRAWRARHGRRSWSRVGDRPAIPVLAAVLAALAFLAVIGPWWIRQLETFGSISPTSSSGAALWIRTYSEWNSITAHPSLDSFLAQGPAAIVASRLAGLSGAIGQFAVLISSLVLVPFAVIGMISRRHARDFRPWFVYALIIFAGATLLYPLHVPGGAFIHSAMGLLPQASILSIEGLLAVGGWIGGRGRRWDEGATASVLVWGVVVSVIAIGSFSASSVLDRWEARHDQRLQLAAELDRLQIPVTDRLMSNDAAGITYATGHPGVVTTNDPPPTLEAIASAYRIRWLVLERGDVADGLAPVLAASPGARPAWIGAPVFTVASADGGVPRLALYPVCVTAGDSRCSGG